MTMEEMMDNHGYRIDNVGGEKRLVTVDEFGRAVIGPKPRRHGRKRRLFGRKDRMVTTDSNAETVVIDLDGVELVRSWRTTLRAKFYDVELHKAIQHTAVDLTIWAAGISLSAAMLKFAWMVVSL